MADRRWAGRSWVAPAGGDGLGTALRVLAAGVIIAALAALWSGALAQANRVDMADSTNDQGTRDPTDDTSGSGGGSGGGSSSGGSAGGGSAGGAGPEEGINNPGIGEGGDTVDVPLPTGAGGAAVGAAAHDFGGNPPSGSVVVLDDRETDALINSGWGGSAPASAARTAPVDPSDDRAGLLVDLAVQQGYAPQVGLAQATYGTPHENGLSDLMQEIAAVEAAPLLDAATEAALTEAVTRAQAMVRQRQAVLSQAEALNQGVAQARADLAEAARALAEARGAMTAERAVAERQRAARLDALRDELRAAIRSLTGAAETNESWLLVNLDANGDGAVDRRDLR